MRNQPVNHIFLQNLVFAERPSAEERICFAYIEWIASAIVLSQRPMQLVVNGEQCKTP